MCQALHFAAGRDVSKPDLICQSGDELVAAGGEGSSDTAVPTIETGQNQEAVFGKRLLPVRRKAHVLKAAGGTDNDGLASTQKNSETLAFHW